MHVNMKWSAWVKKKKSVPSQLNEFGFICAGISSVGGYKRNAWYNLTCLLQTYSHLSTNKKLSFSWVFRDQWRNNNNNDEYLERLTRTGPKCLHVLYKYIFVKIQCIQHECTHTCTHTQSRTHMHTHTHTMVAVVGGRMSQASAWSLAHTMTAHYQDVPRLGRRPAGDCVICAPRASLGLAPSRPPPPRCPCTAHGSLSSPGAWQKPHNHDEKDLIQWQTSYSCLLRQTSIILKMKLHLFFFVALI